VEQCGNGARCLARFVVEKGLTKKTVITESAAFKYSVKNTILVETKKGVIMVAAAMKENVTISRIEPTGNYAIVLFFSDDHDSGIYSWEHLYKLATEQDKLRSGYLTRLKDAGHSHKQH
jgi:DUF971 family protein